MELHNTYFYTATIVEWKPLLQDDKFKDIITGSLKYLSDKNFISVYAFVIMPNHMHLIWELHEMNGNEMPHESFMKFSSHTFLKELKSKNSDKLTGYEVNSSTREHQFWQRDPLPIELYSDKVFEQKLDYIHHNPVQEKWKLAEEPAGYKYSSAKFYETEMDDFGFLKHCSAWQ